MTRKLIGVSIAAGLFGICVSASAGEATSDSFASAQNSDYTHVPGADQAMNGTAATLGVDTYHFTAGSAFTPRRSGQTVTYPGGGCSYSNLALTTGLNLPNGAVVSGVRLFYYSNSPSDKVDMYLSSYPGDGSFNDLLHGASTTGVGYASEYFAFPTPLVIDNYSGAHVLTSTMDSGAHLCGMRVFYSS